MRPSSSLRLAVAGAMVVALAALAPGGARAQTTIPGSGPLLVQGAVDLGPATGSRSVTVVLGLSNQAALSSLLRSGATVSGAQFDSEFAPAQSQVDAVTAWAAAAGLQIDSVSANRTLVRVSGSAATLGTALGTRFDRFATTSGTTYTTNTSAASLPSTIAPGVVALVGLSDVGRLSVRPQAATISYPASYGPQDFWSFYNAPSAQTGSGQTIAIIAEGDLTQAQSDLRTFESHFGLPQVPWTTVGAGSSDTSGSDEWDLDTQYSTGFAPGVSDLRVYDGVSLSNSDILSEITQYVTDNVAKQASFSAGECELLAQVSGFQTALDQELQQAVAQGQTLFASSGDTGSQCPALVGVNGVPAGVPGLNYPAASQFAVGVGGTTITGAQQPLRETGWYAGGGGVSEFEPEPAYQANAGGSNTGLARGVPDVSLDADPESGYIVYVAGQQTVIGGTSASSPSWLGIWARAQAAHGGALGFANNVIYAEPGASFNDIVAGANGAYACTPGYDYVTGRGTPDISAFVTAA